MLITKQVREAREAVVRAAGDTQRAVIIVGAVAAAALLVALVALVLGARRAAS